jgi:hypothetical protein
MSEVKSNKAWRLECESIRAELAALRALLRLVASEVRYSDPRVADSIDAALAKEGK